MSQGRESDYTYEVIGAALAVHKELGVGLLETAYEEALAIELGDRGLEFDRQVRVRANYRGRELGLVLVADLVVERRLLVELKSSSHPSAAHVSQALTYMRLLRLNRGLLINFFVRRLHDGIRRLSI